MKYIPSIIAGLLIALFGGGLVASAQEYIPLVSLPGVSTEGSAMELTNYLSGVMKLTVAIAGALSILMLVIAGTQYVAASINPAAKKDALGKIENSLIGLALVLSSYLLLNTINPELVNFNLNLPSIEATKAPGVTLEEDIDIPGSTAWLGDSTIRQELRLGNVTVNKENCLRVGNTNCTSVASLSASIVQSLIRLADNCKCAVTITGGTEYWLHKSHGSSGNPSTRVDLSQESPTLNTYIKTVKTPPITPSAGCGVSSDPRYNSPDYAITYVDEPNRDSTGAIVGSGRHWHVCY